MKPTRIFPTALLSVLTAWSAWAQPQSYATWAATVFTVAQVADPTISGETANPAHDGVSNLLKYAFNLNPLVPNRSGLPVVGTITSGGSQYLTITYTTQLLAGDLTYSVQASTDLVNWTAITPAAAATTTEVTVQDPTPLSPGIRRFLLVQVVVAPAPTGFALIPAGTFTMGNSLSSSGDGNSGELPTHAVTLPAFYLAKTLTTWADWVAVRDWAVTHGYADLSNIGGGNADTHPAQSVSWYDVVKWCNAKSEKGGLVPVYYTNDAQTAVYRTGGVGVTNAQVKWAASGYRLPTEAEWEYAARGGLAGQRFPWGDTITHSQANYYSSSSYSYDVSPTRGFNPTYATGAYPYTSPVGAFAANGYGLFDMAGNVWEWCWDWYGSYGGAAVVSPLGPSSGAGRVIRGGSWGYDAGYARSAVRGGNDPDARGSSIGFRPARSSVP